MSRDALVDVAEWERQGWTRRTVACEPRLGEMVELYETMGFEVRVIPVASVKGFSDEGSCVACMAGEPDRYRLVFTRRAESAGEAP